MPCWSSSVRCWRHCWCCSCCPRIAGAFERFTTERIKRALPLSEAEIRADKDRIRAEFATEIHKLDMKLEESGLTAARQSVELNRRDARIHELDRALEGQKASVDEHQNARRVLEQTILDRLPKVESRLGEARRMLQQRDGEIATLADTSTRQTEALEQATQINVQLTQEVERLRAALDTRAARNRETIGDPRFDGEVALRSEIEALRAKTREQAQMIDRLQGTGVDMAERAASAAGEPGETAKLRAALAKTEADLLAARQDTSNSGRIAVLEASERESAAEINRLKASLKAYEDGASAAGGDALAVKAELGALQSESGEQRRTIESLRAEVTEANERLSRQAQHFRDEMRRLAAQKSAEHDNAERAAAEAPRLSLAERIAQPRVPRPEAAVEILPVAAEHGREARPAAYLKAVNGGTDVSEADSAAAVPVSADAAAAPRRTRLLERISNIDKSG